MILGVTYYYYLLFYSRLAPEYPFNLINSNCFGVISNKFHNYFLLKLCNIFFLTCLHKGMWKEIRTSDIHLIMCGS